MANQSLSVPPPPPPSRRLALPDARWPPPKAVGDVVWFIQGDSAPRDDPSDRHLTVTEVWSDYAMVLVDQTEQAGGQSLGVRLAQLLYEQPVGLQQFIDNRAVIDALIGDLAVRLTQHETRLREGQRRLDEERQLMTTTYGTQQAATNTLTSRQSSTLAKAPGDQVCIYYARDPFNTTTPRIVLQVVGGIGGVGGFGGSLMSGINAVTPNNTLETFSGTELLYVNPTSLAQMQANCTVIEYNLIDDRRTLPRLQAALEDLIDWLERINVDIVNLSGGRCESY